MIEKLILPNYLFFQSCNPQTGTDPKSELDKAQFQRMQDLLKRKRTAQKEAEVSIAYV